VPIIRYRKPRTRFERARRWVRILLGFSALGFGLLLAVPGVPGPGLVIILGALAILATEYAWARRYLNKLKEEGEKLGSIFFGKREKKE
jgi:tellurite resistance protein TerC